MKDTRIFINTPTPAPLARQIRIVAASLGISRAELMRRAIVDYLRDLDLPKEVELDHKKVMRHI